MNLHDDRWTDTALSELPTEGSFRLRGTNMSRLEAFTDAAFAFAVTLLVISVDEVPSSYDELVTALRSTPAFLACFVQLVMFWLGHRAWHRHFGLEDTVSLWLTLFLIAGVLVLVYPLKVMFSVTWAYLTDGWAPAPFDLTLTSLEFIFLAYGISFGTLSALIMLLYVNALRRKERLRLNELEVYDTRANVTAWLTLSITGYLSATVALLAPGESKSAAGWMYGLLGIIMPALSHFASKRKAALFYAK